MWGWGDMGGAVQIVSKQTCTSLRNTDRSLGYNGTVRILSTSVVRKAGPRTLRWVVLNTFWRCDAHNFGEEAWNQIFHSVGVDSIWFSINALVGRIRKKLRRRGVLDPRLRQPFRLLRGGVGTEVWREAALQVLRSLFYLLFPNMDFGNWDRKYCE